MAVVLFLKVMKDIPGVIVVGKLACCDICCIAVVWSEKLMLVVGGGVFCVLFL